MDCVANIEKLALSKFKEAECLFNNGHYDGAYYTAGYTIELLLKQKFVKILELKIYLMKKAE